MKLFLSYTYYYLLEVFRQPSYLIITMLFPSMFFWFFGIPNATDEASSQMLMGSFSAFAVLSVTVYQLSISLSQERSSSWSRFQRILPVHTAVVLFSRLLASLVLAVLAVSVVVITALIFSKPNLNLEKYILFFSVIMAGAMPFASLGLVIGFWANPKTALPLANLIYLPLSFAGGLWMPPHILPKLIQDISEFLPTRYYGEMVWSSVIDNHAYRVGNLWGLLIYFAIFTFLAFYLYRRDQGQRYR